MVAPSIPSPEIQAALQSGYTTLSAGQTIVFTPYVRTVLQDGLVFWVNASLVPGSPYQPMKVSGSLHYAAEKRQTDTGSVTSTRVVFTTQTNLHEGIEDADPAVIWIGEIDGIRFSFSSFNNYYQQAGTWHYVGDAIYSDMLSQIIDSPGFDTTSRAMSNSMPYWLFLSGYVPSLPAYGYSSPVTFYPAYLVPPNIAPPYASVDVTDTRTVGSIPWESPLSSDYQQCIDSVTITTYGLRNEEARRLIMCVLQRSDDYGEFGIVSNTGVTDDKQNQVELGILAMRKTIRFEISYFQGAARNIARQLIQSALPSYHPIDTPKVPRV